MNLPDDWKEKTIIALKELRVLYVEDRHSGNSKDCPLCILDDTFDSEIQECENGCYYCPWVVLGYTHCSCPGAEFNFETNTKEENIERINEWIERIEDNY